MRISIATSLLFGLVLGFSAGTGAATAQAPSVSLKPSSGMAGSQFTIGWAGFAKCRTIAFSWDGSPLASVVAPASSGSVGASVPAGAAPGAHTVQGVCASQELSASAVFTVLGPTTSKPPVTTTKPPVVTTKPPVTTTPPPATTTTTTTTTSPPEIEPPASVAEEPPPPADGVLVLDRPSVNPGDPLAASGAGCDPGARVELTSDGLPVGAAVADAAGAFGTKVEFTRIEPGRHWVVADCGIRLAGAVDQTLTSSTGGGTAALVVLVFFLLAGISLVRVR
ncbi:hypothetical protein [Amycolatopsis magusensis]|uniref:hypothetical protein n=1 Tax=Amycolatopsis magusensis TaxID=882444 RepID=UPI003C2CE145